MSCHVEVVGAPLLSITPVAREERLTHGPWTTGR